MVDVPAITVGSKLSLPLFVAAEALSLFGNAAIGIVLPWLVLTRTGDPSVAGLVAAVAALPAILAALVGGWLIDHVGQRRMSVIADLGSAASVAGLAVVDRVFGLDLGWFIVLGVVGALFDVPGMTARETLMGRVSRTSGVTLDKTAAIRQGVFGVAFLGGPALAGILLTLLDPISVVWVTALCSGLAAVCMLLLPLVAGEEVAVGDAMVGGLETIRRSRGLRAMLVIGFGAALISAPLLSLLLPAHYSALGQPDWLGFTLSAFAAGSMAGAILYAWLSAKSRRLVWVTGVALQTLGMVGFASLTGFWPVAIGSLILGIGGGLLSPIFLVYFTERVAESVRGRVLGLFNALALIAAPVGLGAMALVLTVAPLSVGALLVLAGWLVVAAFSLLSKGVRDFVADPAPRPPDAADQGDEAADDEHAEHADHQ